MNNRDKIQTGSKLIGYSLNVYLEFFSSFSTALLRLYKNE